MTKPKVYQRKMKDGRIGLFTAPEGESGTFLGYAKTTPPKEGETLASQIGMYEDGGGVFGAFDAPTASSTMFEALSGKTNMFKDPMGSKTLGAVNRAIVGAPIDAIDLVGRVGDTALRGVASGASKLAQGLGMGEGMADRLKRDVYGLGIAASTLAPTAAPRPRGKSNKALVIEAQKDKVKSPVAKQKLDEDLEMEAINDALKDAYLDLDDTLSFQSFDDIAITTEDFGDVLTNNFAGFRGEGKSRGEAMADAIKMTQDDFNVVIDRPIQDKIFARLDDDYDFGVKRALNRREKAAANKAALETELAKARNVNNPIRTVNIDEATRMQNEISGMGIPQPTPQKPALTVIEGGQPSKKKLSDDFRKEFAYDVYHGQRDPEISTGVVKTKDGREILVEDATGEYGGINAFESSTDKFPGIHPSDLGTWVSESRDVANYFAGDTGAVYPLKMRMKRPKKYETYEDMEEAFSQFDDSESFVNHLKKQGHDGIEIIESFTDIPEYRTDYVVFEGNQLRSKNARFDPEKRSSRNITYKQGGMVYNPFKQGIGAI